MTPLFTGPGAVRKTLDLTLWAESIGYEDAWLPDTGAVDALTLAALLLDRTERMRVGCDRGHARGHRAWPLRPRTWQRVGDDDQRLARAGVPQTASPRARDRDA